MKDRSTIFILLPLVVIACYIGRALITGWLRIRGGEEPIRLKDSPRDYWSNFTIVLVIFVIIVAIVVWVFL